jgi:hypothetical protein
MKDNSEAQKLAVEHTLKIMQAKQETEAIVQVTKDQNIKIPELQSLDDRIAMLEKKQKDSLALKTPETKTTALAQ